MNEMIEILTPNFNHIDERGTLTQLVREGYKQVNVVTSKAGAKRGGHYHKINRETFYIIKGKIQVTVRLGDEEQIHYFGAGDMFLIPPLVMHYFTYLEDTTLIGLYDKGIELENGNKDIYAC